MEILKTLTIAILTVFKVSAETQINKARWIENIMDKNSAYDKSEFANFVPSLSICASLCSRHIDWDACTYNNQNKECRAFDYEDKGTKSVESGTRLWIREGSCRLNFVKVSGFQQCIKLFPMVRGWDAAQRKCNSINAELVIVDTQEKLHGLSGYIRDSQVSSTIMIGNRNFLDGTPIKANKCMGYVQEELKEDDCSHKHEYVCQYL